MLRSFSQKRLAQGQFFTFGGGRYMNLRIGAVSYLNTKPLIYGLREAMPRGQLLLDLPSRLADRLRSGDLDVALIPSVEFLRQTDLSVVSDACIACHGPVRSVQLLFHKPPEEISSLALDEGSRTSAALAQILLARRFGNRPKLVPLPITSKFDQFDADALVVIGDRAMQIDATGYHEVWDLGQEWHRETQLPFVFAMWVASDPTVSSELSGILQSCRDQGLQHLDDIISNEAAKYALSREDCRKYFAEQLYFYLGERELRGLELFREQAIELELLPLSCKKLSLEPV